MVETRVPPEPNTEFFSLIPMQQRKIAELMAQKKILSYTLSIDRLKLWIIMNAESESDARQTLAEQPMDKYFDYHFHELMFHEMANTVFPAVSLN
jgi:hypothetical protein